MPLPNRFNEETIKQLLSNPSQFAGDDRYMEADVLIAGTGPVGATYARIILDDPNLPPGTRVVMADIGAQEGPIIGVHQKNAIKYQKDLDMFVNVVDAALQPISVPPGDTYIPNLGGEAWVPGLEQALIFHGSNPKQDPRLNLACPITRAVGGMGTHWTCGCPAPRQAEREILTQTIPHIDELLDTAGNLLNVHEHEFDGSIRQTVIKEALERNSLTSGRVQHLPLAVKRRTDNDHYVTWSGPNTILGDHIPSDDVVEDPPPKFQLLAEHQVTMVLRQIGPDQRISGVLLKDLGNDQNVYVNVQAVVLCCGAIATPQILYNSLIRPAPLGHYLCEQSIAFCQIVLKREFIDTIANDPRFAEAVGEHRAKYPNDPLPIPFLDPETQLTLPFDSQNDHPWHVQIHRDAFSYGAVGPRADRRVVLDLRFFGRQEIQESNCVDFSPMIQLRDGSWKPGNTDIYGMPQPTFYVQRSREDDRLDQIMMKEMTDVANILGSYLPGSNPQFMAPGLAFHITGTTRIGLERQDSVADAKSRVHGFDNLWVGGNGCIPDSTACNPTRTSVAIAIEGARAVLEYLKSLPKN